MAEPKVLDFDELIDDILAKKGPSKYTDGLSEDNWEQELENIPLFMTQSPVGEVDPVKAPGVAALQALKYETSTPLGRANAHKTEGNELFRQRHYSKAVAEYSAALKERGERDTEEWVELTTVLFTNRAAAQFYLRNYRSALNDATEAKKLKPDHIKALVRGVLCCVQLSRYGEAVQWCDEGLKVDPDNQQIRELRVKAANNKKKVERDERKQSATEKKLKDQQDQLLSVIKSRGVCMAGGVSEGPGDGRVHMGEDGSLMWPVIFFYPEYRQSDFIQAMSETHRLCDHVELMFGSESAPWDKEGVYTPDNIKVYYEHATSQTLREVSVELSLREALTMDGVVVKCGTPSFILLSTKSSFHQHYLTKTR